MATITTKDGAQICFKAWVDSNGRASGESVESANGVARKSVALQEMPF